LNALVSDGRAHASRRTLSRAAGRFLWHRGRCRVRGTRTYFAGLGNRFWSILAEIKLTSHQLKLDELRLLPTFGIGLTDIAKSVSGADSELPIGSFDVPGFANRIRVVRPRLVAFNGTRAAGAFRPYRTATPLCH
jgi:hypothetical protein